MDQIQKRYDRGKTEGIHLKVCGLILTLYKFVNAVKTRLMDRDKELMGQKLSD